MRRRTANKKLTKLYCTPRKRSPKRLLGEPKKWRGKTNNTRFVFPHFQFCFGTTDTASMVSEGLGSELVIVLLVLIVLIVIAYWTVC